MVQSVHEKERNIFREALLARDFAKAYQIYEEQRGLPILSGAEVTSLVQLINADASLRKWNGYEQPESLQQVFWTIIDDVKQHKVAAQTMLWVHALEVLVTWDKLDEARELWSWLQTLPNRSTVDKNDAHCIDSRVYGGAIRLHTALGDMAEVEKLYTEALTERRLMPSIMIDQALISALFVNRRVGDAYKAMDKTIREQRRALRPGFFNNMISLALDADAIGVATEIFMKACKVKMPPSSTIVTRLLAGLGRSRTDPLNSVLTLFKHYRAVSGEAVPIQHINCVIHAMFTSFHFGVSKQEVLTRVHQLLNEMKERGLHSSISTVNILLKGYISLAEYKLAEDLLSRATLDQNSLRAILKGFAQSPSPSAFPRIQEYWKRFEEQQSKDSDTETASRDLLMLMRAAFVNDKAAAELWIPQVLLQHASTLDPHAQQVLDTELNRHTDGTFTYEKPN